MFLLWTFCLIASINEFAAEKVYFCIAGSMRITRVEPAEVKVGLYRNEAKKVILENYNLLHDTFGDMQQN